MVNTATICMYMHGQYCYNMYVHAWSILLQYVCTCMVNTATICMYMHGQYCYNMYVQAWSILLQYVCKAWYISRITREYPTDSLLTTHAHYIREGFVGGR